MRVGVLTTSYPRFDGDHAGHFVQGFARALASRGHSIEVVAPAPPNNHTPPHDAGVDLSWVRYAPVRSWQRAFYGSGAPVQIRDPRNGLGALAFCGRALQHARNIRHNIDAWVSHWALPSGAIAQQVAHGKPHLCVMHETDVRWLEMLPLGQRVARHIAHNASALWFLSDALQTRFERLSRHQHDTVHVGPMGTWLPDPRHRAQGAAPTESAAGSMRLLFIGRLIELKGADVLLHAAASMSEQPTVDILGDGPERAPLQTLATTLGVRARFHGHTIGEDKTALLTQATALVVPSRTLGAEQDGAPSVILEAMAHGTPVVAADTGSVRAIVTETNGLLFEQDNPAALARTLDRLKDRQLRDQLVESGRLTATSLSWPALAPTIEQLLAH